VIATFPATATSSRDWAELKRLHETNVITAKEYEKQRAEIIGEL